MDFRINRCNHPLDFAEPMIFTPETLEKIFTYCTTNYFGRPNYLKIDGRPVFIGWNLGNVIKQCGGTEKLKAEIVPWQNKVCRKNGSEVPYPIYINTEPQQLEKDPKNSQTLTLTNESAYIQ